MLIKYPRTFHLPWSLGRTDDDKVLSDVSSFEGKEIIVTEKMDGENSTLYSTGKTHARSIDSSSHESRDWLKSFWSERCYKMPENMRICGENLYARHTLEYNSLPSYFLGFSAWEDDVCLSWEDTKIWFEELEIIPVPEIYRGIFNEKLLSGMKIKDGTEGYVIRIIDSFKLNDFQKSIAKCVRKNHVNTDSHWMYNKVIKNKLLKDHQRP